MANPLFTAKPKRKYKLTAAGRKALRGSINAIKPWEKSTGPRTVLGKIVSRQNAIKHGLCSPEFGPQRADYAAHQRRTRTGARERQDCGPPVAPIM